MKVCFLAQASLCVFSKIKESLRSSLYDAELKTETMVPGNCLGRIIGKKGSVVSILSYFLFLTICESIISRTSV